MLNVLTLSDREKTIVKMVAKGYDNEEIAGKLFVSVHTVKAHISMILKKNEIRNRTELAYMVGKYNIV